MQVCKIKLQYPYFKYMVRYVQNKPDMMSMTMAMKECYVNAGKVNFL